MNLEKKICVLGLGYIGLPTAALLAARGLIVEGVDVNPRVVEVVNNGGIHIVEPELDIVVRAAVHSKKLTASLEVKAADIFIIAVPTPFTENKEPDLSYIQRAITNLAPVIERGNLVILESTSPVGATEKIAEWLGELRPDLKIPQFKGEVGDIFIAYCPERVLPGKVLRELVENDRVIGGMTQSCSQKALDFYSLFVEGQLIRTDVRTAEMVKLTENSFRDVNIAFANELSIICDHIDVNVWELIQLANHHPRVNILNPGPGVGGHCIAVDPWFIIHRSPEEAKLIRCAREVNDTKPEWVLDKVREELTKIQSNKNQLAKVACLGLTFKADVDDVRESPSLEIAKHLAFEFPGQIVFVDPNIEDSSKLELELSNLESALLESDLVLLLVDHKEFKDLDLSQCQGKVFIDTKGIWS